MNLHFRGEYTMKFIKWKSIIITCIICLLPVLLGIALWDDLPDTMAIHFNINNEPDNFASKSFVVFGIPVLMIALQIICCFTNDINSHKHDGQKKFEKATKWIIPIMTVVLQVITYGYSLGWNIDIRKSAALIIGVVFLILGIYLPKLDYVKNYNIDAEKARKLNRLMGYETIVMGFLSLVSMFLPPIATVIWLFLLIPYTLIGIIYGIRYTSNKCRS